MHYNINSCWDKKKETGNKNYREKLAAESTFCSSYLTDYIGYFLYFTKKKPVKRLWKIFFIIFANLWRRGYKIGCIFLSWEILSKRYYGRMFPNRYFVTYSWKYPGVNKIVCLSCNLAPRLNSNMQNSMVMFTFSF